MTTQTRSESLYAEARKYLPGGVSSNFRYGDRPVPRFYASAAGAYLYDLDGNRYIDHALGNGPVILGHAPAEPIRAVADTLERGQLYAGQHELEVELARLVVEMVPGAERVRFSSSGSEAIQAALRLARAWTGRQRIVKFEGHYHGWLDNIFVSVRPPADGSADVDGWPQPYPQSPGQSEAALQDIDVLRWNDADMLAALLDDRGDRIAAVIMEPVMCNAGVIPPREGYLERVRELCDRHGVVLVFDEVITGFRLGPGGAQGYFGVTPDLAVFAKAMGAGFPISALTGRAELMDLLVEPGVMHGGTYNSNVVTVAATLAALRQIRRESETLYPRMETLGRRLMEGIETRARQHGHEILVQGFGPVFHPAFTDRREIADYRDFAAVDAARQTAFVHALQDCGVRPTTRGTWFLSAAHSEDDVEAALHAVDAAFRQIG